MNRLLHLFTATSLAWACSKSAPSRSEDPVRPTPKPTETTPMPTSPQVPTFGDNVRVRDTPATKKAGLAGSVGQVYGETTPSVTGVDVIGNAADDYAINVQLEGQDDTHWFDPDLLDVIDHAPGTEIRLDGVPKKWVRKEDGSWDEQDDPDAPTPEDGSAEKQDDPGEPAGKPWWKFW